MFYFVKKPVWLRKFYGDATWQVATTDKVLYLTFDDGPDPEATPFVLEQLEKYNAKATFFCIGRNVEQHQQLFAEVVSQGHAVGNHTYSHIDGWKTNNKKYFSDIATASSLIQSDLFRPPYGHVTWRQVNLLKNNEQPLRTFLWSVLSADFDENTPEEKCLYNVTTHAGEGDIVLFHDSKGAMKNLRYALPRVLQHYTQQGFRFQALPQVQP